MSALVKIKEMYYFRLRIPKDVRIFFPYPEIKKSTHTSKYIHAKGLARGLLGKAEELFMVIRSKSLDDAAIFKIVREFVESTLELKYDAVEEVINSPDSYDMLKEVYSDAQNEIRWAVKNRSEVGGLHMMGFTGVQADYLCHSAGYGIEEDTPQFKKLVHQLALAKKDIIQTLQERLENGDSDYDIKQRALKDQQLAEIAKSDTLSGLIAAYCRAKGGVTGTGRKGKLAEKMDKIRECFQFETGKQELLLSEITYDLTERVGRRLAKYPLYRNGRYEGKTLQQIYEIEGVESSSECMAREELSRLSGLFDFAVNKLEGLRKNYAMNLGDVVLGKDKSKANSARDIFRPADIHEIISVLGELLAKGVFDKNPHLLFITLIGFFSGARINEICQLTVQDIIQVDGLWCFNHLVDESTDKSLKNINSIRTNPIHLALTDFGLLRFWEVQKAKGYTGLWDGAINHRCDYYKKSGNCSHYVSKWWNGTFKAKLTLTNNEKQTFHSTRHTFINWFKQNVRPLDYEARNALSGHLDNDDLAALALQGYDEDSEGEVTYTKGLNVKRQMELLEKLDYGIDLTPLRII